MTVEPDFSSFMAQPAPAAPLAAPPPSPADMLKQLGEQLAQQAPARAVTPPMQKLTAGGGRAAVSAAAGQAAISDPTNQTPDSMTFAERILAGFHQQNPMGRARIAATVETYGENLARTGAVDPNGARAAAQLDFEKARSLLESGGVANTDIGKELKRLWGRFERNPDSLSDGEVSGLVDLVGQIGTTTEGFRSIDLTTEDGKVDNVDLLPDGAVPRFRLKNKMVLGRMLASVSERIPELSTDGDSVHLLPDQTSVAVSAHQENAAVLRNLYPAIGSMWAPVKPRTVPDTEQLAQSWEDVPGLVSESWPPGAWDDLGGHPALQGEVTVTAIMPDGPLPRAFRKLGVVQMPNGAGVLETPNTQPSDLPDDEPTVPVRQTSRARRVVLQVNPDDNPAVTAAEVEQLGGQDVVVYAPGNAPDGWTDAREHFFRDPSGGLKIVRSAAGDRSAPHGVTAWVRQQDLPTDVPGTERTPEAIVAKPIAQGVYQFGDVTVQTSGKFDKPDILSASSQSGRLVGVGYTDVGGLPTLTTVFEGQSEQGFDAYARVDGRRLVLQADPQDLAPAVQMGLVLGRAGVKPTRVSLEGTKHRTLAFG